ncbi:MAG: hypothetical protein ACREH9_04815, partial [Pseudomonadota bacterium]
MSVKTIFSKSKNNPAASADAVQVRRYENLTNTEREKILEMTGRAYDPVHWIYARVLEVSPEGAPDGALRVRVEHPGNRDHDRELIVKAGEYRTAEDVAAALQVAQREHDFRPSRHAGALVQH